MIKMTVVTGILVAVCSSANCPQKSSIQIVAHRGASYDAPENTLAAFQLAWGVNVDAVELDIYQSRDGKIMVIHDSTTGRTAQRDIPVSESDSEQLRRLDVGSFKGKQYAGEQIPYLQEVLTALPKGCDVFIEIKCGKEVLPTLQKMIVASHKASQIHVIGFNLDTIAEFKRLMPQIKVYWLLAVAEGTNSYDSKTIIDSAKARDIDGLDLCNIGLKKELVDAAKAANLGVYVWTVDDPSEARRLAELGVDGITTNRPDLIRQSVK